LGAAIDVGTEADAAAAGSRIACARSITFSRAQSVFETRSFENSLLGSNGKYGRRLCFGLAFP
jgi:hypothetical protein